MTSTMTDKSVVAVPRSSSCWRFGVLLLNLFVPSSASSNSYAANIAKYWDPVLLESGLSKRFKTRWNNAKALADLEQAVEDVNAEWIAQHPQRVDGTTPAALTKRRLICLPLDDRFDPPLGVFSHGHVQTGDKMSLPSIFGQAIKDHHAEVPWLFEVRRVHGGASLEEEDKDDKEHLAFTRHRRTDLSEELTLEHLEKVVGGPLDFRAPPNYVFLPWWMMRALGLQPRDVVDVQLCMKTPPGSLARLRPHSSEFSKDIANPQAVLETELRHYSSLTKGTTIAFDYNKKRYWFDVVELRSAPRGEKQPMVKVQDCDIATDFLPAKDTLKKKKQKHSLADNQ